MKSPHQLVRLILMRHAKSSWANNSLNDHDRPLNDRGNSAAPVMAKWLIDNDLFPEQILCSSALRTQQTAEILLKIAKKPEIDKKRDAADATLPLNSTSMLTLQELYLASPQVILRTIRQNASPEAKSVLVLGHNPGMEILVSSISNQFTEMPTAALAVFSVSRTQWSSFLQSSQEDVVSSFVREAFVRPRDLTAN